MAEKNLVEAGKKYIFAEKYQQWEENTKNLSEDVLEKTLEIMAILDSGYNFKKVHKAVESISDKSQKEIVLRLLTNFSYRGPEYAYDRLFKEQHGKVDRNNEFVKALFYKMDENDILKGREKE